MRAARAQGGTSRRWPLALAAGALALLGVASTARAAFTDDPARTFLTNGPVHAIAPTPQAIYIGGDFTRVSPRTGPGVRLDAATGRPRGHREVAAQVGIAGAFPPARVLASAPDGAGGFYVGGEFDRIGRRPVQNLAHILADGSVDPRFHPNPNRAVSALELAGPILYVGGTFDSIAGQTRHALAALDSDTGAPSGWNPDMSVSQCCGGAGVEEIAVSGSTVYVSGFFDHVGFQPRANLAAIDATSGAATGWAPDITDIQRRAGAVHAIAIDGATVYVGGRFRHASGSLRRNIAALDAVTGQAAAWNPSAEGPVSDLELTNEGLYVSGLFDAIGGQPRRGLAALDPVTGAATGWNARVCCVVPDPTRGLALVNDIEISGPVVYVGGRFRRAGGHPRANLAALDRTTGEATGWNPHAGGDVKTVAASGSMVYAGGDFNSVGGRRRGDVAALDPDTGAVLDWDPDADGSGVRALAISGPTVYVGGSFASIGGRPRANIAALDRIAGDATGWDPSATAATCCATVESLAVAGPTIYASGAYDSIGGRGRRGLAALDATTGVATAWNPRPNGPVQALAASGPTVYAGGDFTMIGGQARTDLAALEVTSGGATSWDPVVGPPGHQAQINELALSNTTVYAGGTFGSIGGQPRSRIAAIDAATGEPTSWNPGVGPPSGSVAAIVRSGPLVVAGGFFKTFGGRGHANLAAVDATTGMATSWDPQPDGLGGTVLDLALGPDGSLWAGGFFQRFRGVQQAGIARFTP